MENITLHEGVTGAEQEKLLQSLLREKEPGIEDLKKFRNGIIDLDQSKTHVEEAQNNIAILEDERFKKILKKILEGIEDLEEKEEINQSSNLLLSLSYFHYAQGLLFKEQIEDERKSEIIESFEMSKFYKDKYPDWYVEGTLAYLNSKEIELKNIIESTQVNKYTGNNKEILKRFLKSLQAGDNPFENYIDAYAGVVK